MYRNMYFLRKEKKLEGKSSEVCNNWVTRPHVAFYLFYTPFLISRQTDATSDLAAYMLVCPRIRYLVLCTRWQKRNIVTVSALNSDNVSRAFDLSLSLSLLRYPCPCLPSSVSSSLPLAYLSFCSFLSLPPPPTPRLLFSPSLFPHFSPCRQHRRIMNRGSVSDTKALPAMTTPESS